VLPLVIVAISDDPLPPTRYTLYPVAPLTAVQLRFIWVGPFAVAVRLVGADGIALLTVKVYAADVPPPGVGLTTVIDSDPAADMSLAVIVAVRSVALTNVVVRLLPPTSTTDVLT
jgi:hypothetical protein